MREVSATEASRNFSSVLDAAENGETIVVTRAGEPVATIAPAPRANGGAVRELFARQAELARHRSEAEAEADAAFERAVLEVRDVVSAELDGDPWHD